jgi:hypothetical protein
MFRLQFGFRLLARTVLPALAVLFICGSVAGRTFVAGIRHQRHRPLVRCDTNFWERLPQPLFHLAARGLGHPKPSRNPRLPWCLSCERLDRRGQFATAHSGGQTTVKFLRRRNVMIRSCSCVVRSSIMAPRRPLPISTALGVRKGPISVVSAPSRCRRWPDPDLLSVASKTPPQSLWPSFRIGRSSHRGTV